MLRLALLLWLAGCTAGPLSEVREEPFEPDERVFTQLPTNFTPVQVGEEEFIEGLASLLLEMPLPVAASQPPLYASRK